MSSTFCLDLIFKRVRVRVWGVLELVRPTGAVRLDVYSLLENDDLLGVTGKLEFDQFFLQCCDWLCLCFLVCCGDEGPARPSPVQMEAEPGLEHTS